MSNNTRPFDIRPASKCLTCGAPIAGGAYCLQCEPVGVGDWVRFRWFSGPAVEAKRKRAASRDAVKTAFAGTIAAVLAVVFVGQFAMQSGGLASVASNARRPGIERTIKHGLGAKRPLDTVTIS